VARPCSPPSLRVLSAIARNVWRSLVMLRYIFGADLDDLGLERWLGPLEWLASDQEVLKLSGFKAG